MNPIPEVLATMLIFFAMGLQNAGGRIHAKEFLAPTTVMTGNVTHYVIYLTDYLKNIDQEKQNLKIKIVQTMYVIFPFLTGCICWGIITKTAGLGSAVFIGLLTLFLGLFRSLHKALPPIHIAH